MCYPFNTQIRKKRKTRLLILKTKRRSDHESITDDIPALAKGTRNRFVHQRIKPPNALTL